MSTIADQSAGSAREIQVPDDVHSSLLREVVQQLNQQEIPLSKTLALAAGGTLRIPLGSWRYDAWIKDIRIINPTAAALADAGTDILLKTCGPADCDMVTGPVAPATLFSVEGFGTNNFPAGAAIWGDEFDNTVNCDLVSGVPQGNVVRGGDLLYAELVNNEGGGVGAAEVIVLITVVTTDYIKMFSSHQQPGDEVPYQDKVDFQPNQVHVAPQFKVPYQALPQHFFHTRARRRI